MNLDRSILKGFLEKKSLTLEEKEQLLEYLEGDSLADLETVAAEEFFRELDAEEDFVTAYSSEEVLRKIHQRIIVPKPSFVQVVMSHRAKFAVAASVLLVASLFFLFKESSIINPLDKKIALVHTGKSERKVVKLPDGSLVSMEPGSSLEYPEVFNEKTRDVNLKGEAFFEVAKDAAHPFIVHSPNINTTVLGTSFNVEANESGFAKVEVVTGKVKVQVNNEASQWVVLTPSQSTVFNGNTGKLQSGEVPRDAMFYKNRRHGMLKYRGVALKKVVEDLQHYYNEIIIVEGNANAYLFYGDFIVDEKLEKALKLIALSINATIKKDRKGYLIVGGSSR